MKRCIICKKKLTGKRRKFCSKKCWINHPSKKRYIKNHKEYYTQYFKEYRKINKDKVNARNRAKFFSLDDKKCEDCGNKAVDRHHEDYSKPLEIKFLCKKCHKKIHRRKQNE